MRGLRVSGPFATAEEAIASLEHEVPACAVLDVNLGRGKTSYDLADALQARGVPFAFLTGCAQLVGRETDFDGVPLIPKPVSPERALDMARQPIDGTGRSRGPSAVLADRRGGRGATAQAQGGAVRDRKAAMPARASSVSQLSASAATLASMAASSMGGPSDRARALARPTAPGATDR